MEYVNLTGDLIDERSATILEYPPFATLVRLAGRTFIVAKGFFVIIIVKRLF